MVWVRITCGLGSSVSGDILLVSSGGCLEMEVVCLLGTVSIPDGLVSVGKDTFSMPFGLK